MADVALQVGDDQVRVGGGAGAAQLDAEEGAAANACSVCGGAGKRELVMVDGGADAVQLDAAGCRVQGAGCWCGVQGARCRVQGAGCGVLACSRPF